MKAKKKFWINAIIIWTVLSWTLKIIYGKTIITWFIKITKKGGIDLKMITSILASLCIILILSLIYFYIKTKIKALIEKKWQKYGRCRCPACEKNLSELRFCLSGFYFYRECINEKCDCYTDRSRFELTNLAEE